MKFHRGELVQRYENELLYPVFSESATIGTRLYMMGGADETSIYGDFHVLEIGMLRESLTI